ncbi:MAG TPA: disulfide bond formation protein B [Rhizomicrobium sp.]|jgi:disulfide bond formation protein DsbB
MTDSLRISLALGALGLALILGALGFQYLAHLPPCELCMWQRYPHIAAAVIGLGGGLLIQFGVLGRGLARPLAALAILLVAISGAIAVYHAGVEWHWWQGPSTCTGHAFVATDGPLDLNTPVMMCDHAAWRLFGLSLAGYNAIISLGAALIGAVMLSRAKS